MDTKRADALQLKAKWASVLHFRVTVACSERDADRRNALHNRMHLTNFLTCYDDDKIHYNICIGTIVGA